MKQQIAPRENDPRRLVRAQRKLRRIVESGVFPLKTLSNEFAMSEATLRNFYTGRTRKPQRKDLPELIEIYHALLKTGSPAFKAVYGTTNRKTDTSQHLSHKVNPTPADLPRTMSQDHSPAKLPPNAVHNEQKAYRHFPTTGDDSITDIRAQSYRHLKDKFHEHGDKYLQRFKNLGEQITAEKIRMHKDLHDHLLHLCGEEFSKKTAHYQAQFDELSKDRPDDISLQFQSSVAMLILLIGVLKDKGDQEAEARLLEGIQIEEEYFRTRYAEEQDRLLQAIESDCLLAKNELDNLDTTDKIFEFLHSSINQFDNHYANLTFPDFRKDVAIEKWMSTKEMTSQIRSYFHFPALDKAIRQLQHHKNSDPAILFPESVRRLMEQRKASNSKSKKRRRTR